MTDELLARIRDECVLSGNYVSSAGLSLQRYIDVKKALLTGSLASEIAKRFGGLIPQGTTLVAGKGVGAELLVSALVYEHNLSGARVLDSEEMGLSGERRNILGHVPSPRDNVLIVDDVSTTGRSLYGAREIIKQTRAKIIGYAVVVKRREPIEGLLDSELLYLFTEEDLVSS